MEENKNGENPMAENGSQTSQRTQEPPRTYGEESRIFAEQRYSQQPGYGQPQGYSQQPGYGQQPGSQPYYNQPYANNGYGASPEPVHHPVTNIFCYILLVLMPLRIILSFFSTNIMIGSLTYDSIIDSSYMNSMLGTTNMVLSALISLFSIAFLVFMIVDIVMVYRGNYKITGLILFAIFLNPGYYIWRAHILGQKKTVPIIYTVAYSLLLLAYIIYTFFAVFTSVMGLMQGVY